MKGHHQTQKRMPEDDSRMSAGQAMIEFISGILLLMLLAAGFIHIVKMTRTSLFLHSVLRGNAGLSAMQNVLSASPDAISDWNPGPDQVRYTADDTSIGNSASTVLSVMTDTSVRQPEDWRHVTTQSQLPVSMVRLHDSMLTATLLGCAHAQETLHVPVDPVIRSLVYDKDEVAIKEEVWMPLMGGLY